MASPRILIVDDEPFNVEYLQQELEDIDCETSNAANGQEALERVRSDPPDLILLDIMMPVMDGFEALSRLKADPETRNIPVIVISAASDLRSMVKGIALGAEDFLPKPFEPTLLRARLGSSLEKKRLHDLEQLYLKGLERELDIARDIQQGFLPSELPHVEGWQIAAYFKSAREVAGDFYDAFLLANGDLVCVVGDVCDKGVGAALFMTLFRSLIRAAFTAEAFSGAGTIGSLPPREMLQRAISFTSNYVAETHGEANMFATVFLGVIHPQDGTLTYANCGNEPPLIASRDGTLAALAPTGPVVGIIPNAKFGVREMTLKPDDLLIAVTDGIPDAVNSQGESFGRARLEALLKGGSVAPDEFVRRLEAELAGFVGATQPFDDITLLAVSPR
jgi:serine phosphatase RsbU (regulator of sigma subunit)